jgi:hypothetical protein
MTHMTRYCRYFLMLPLLLLWIPSAHAQISATFGAGAGSAHAEPSGAGIYNLNSPFAFGSCTPGQSPNCDATPGLNGLFIGFSGDALFTDHFGIGGEVTFLPSKGKYGPMQFRQTFYDFNAIYAPVNEKRVVVKLMGGLGGARTSFYFDDTSCVGTAVCNTTTYNIGSSNHFQLHAGGGVEIYLTRHFFVRPQFDLRYVPNFTEQFGSDLVPSGMFWIGFGSARY